MRTDWRCMAYGPIGDPVRRSHDRRRSNTWNILLTCTVDGYLILRIRDGFENADNFFQRVTEKLLPYRERE